MKKNNKNVKDMIESYVQDHMLKNLLFENMLIEAEETMGAQFERDEETSKQNYEEKKNALVLWDENNHKKQAFNIEAKRLGLSPTGDAARRLKLNPKFNYNAILASKQKDSLLKDLDKAEAHYASYNPQIRGYRRERKQYIKKALNRKLPSKKHSQMNINTIPGLKWIDWPKDIKNCGFSYGSKASVNDHETASGVGPGEEWLGWVFGAEVQGGTVSYDLITQDGLSWEVKQLLKPSDLIRPGTEGLKAFDDARVRLNKIMIQIKEFVIIAKKIKLGSMLSDEDHKRLDYLSDFTSDQFEMIVTKGEISKERLIDLRAALYAINKIKLNVGENKNNKLKTSVSLNRKTYVVDKPTFIDVAKKIEKSTNNSSVLNDIEEVDIAMTTLRDKAFDDPKKFFNEWFESIKISHVFSQIDGGVFIVNPKSFMMIPIDSAQAVIKFDSVSQGKPKFKLTIF